MIINENKILLYKIIAIKYFDMILGERSDIYKSDIYIKRAEERAKNICTKDDPEYAEIIASNYRILTSNAIRLKEMKHVSAYSNYPMYVSSEHDNLLPLLIFDRKDFEKFVMDIFMDGKELKRLRFLSSISHNRLIEILGMSAEKFNNSIKKAIEIDGVSYSNLIGKEIFKLFKKYDKVPELIEFLVKNYQGELLGTLSTTNDYMMFKGLKSLFMPKVILHREHKFYVIPCSHEYTEG